MGKRAAQCDNDNTDDNPRKRVDSTADDARHTHTQWHALTRRDLLRAGFGVAGAGLLAGCGVSSTHGASPLIGNVPAFTPTTQPSPTQDTRPISIVVTGDIMLARSVGARILASNDLYPFAGTAKVLRSHDLRIGNLECVVSTLGSPLPKQYTFEAPLRAFDRLSAAGYHIVSVANNHSGDYGKAAFSDMLARMPGYGITPVGGGANRTLAHRPVIRTIRGTRIGILAYCDIGPNSFAATDTTPGHAWLDDVAMPQDIAATRPMVDFLIVFTHWGQEYHLVENDLQRYLAHKAIDAGADLVVGAHPHVIEPSETYHGKPIIYSLGNFVFDEMPGVDALGNVLSLTVKGSQLLSWKLLPTRIGNDAAPVWIA
jgi:poly-gamma-glutamate capsule biosynthesis protein CapA/YwtB (metallophosphatase superfamily)